MSLDAATTLICVDEIHNLNLGTRHGAEASDTLKYFAERIPATFVYANAGTFTAALVPADPPTVTVEATNSGNFWYPASYPGPPAGGRSYCPGFLSPFDVPAFASRVPPGTEIPMSRTDVLPCRGRDDQGGDGACFWGRVKADFRRPGFV